MGAQQSRPVNHYRPGYHTNRSVTHLAWLFGSIVQFLHTSDYKPPVTLGLIAGNTALYFSRTMASFPVQLPLLSIRKHALQPYMILEGHQWGRLLASAFIHQDEAHLSYNMTSLLWKGAQLETAQGSLRFAALVAELLVVSHAMVVGASYLLKEISPDYGYLYYQTGAVGFSAVLFGLKVVLNYRSPNYSTLMGITLPSNYMCWLELVVAQLVNPQASFLGHICGILAGLLHVHYTSGWAAALTGRVRRLIVGRGRSSQYFSFSRRTGRRAAMPAGTSSSRPAVAAATGQRPGLSSATAASPQQSTPRRQQEVPHLLGGVQDGSSSSGQPSQEELRQRRLARFGQS